MQADITPMHLVFASTQRNFDAWRKSHRILPSNCTRITSYEQLTNVKPGPNTGVIWHVLEGYEGAHLIMAARTRGMPLSLSYEPIYNTQIPTGEPLHMPSHVPYGDGKQDG